MVLEAHDKAFDFFGGGCVNGIHDNMRTAVDAVLSGKARKFNKAFSEMCSRHLVNPIACSRAAGWEQGQVENLVKETRAFNCTPRLEVADFEELNERPRQDAIKRAKKLRHPAAPERTVREMFQRERPFLTPLPKPLAQFTSRVRACYVFCEIRRMD